jgi:hypothetical protein
MAPEKTPSRCGILKPSSRLSSDRAKGLFTTGSGMDLRPCNGLFRLALVQ